MAKTRTELEREQKQMLGKIAVLEKAVKSIKGSISKLGKAVKDLKKE